MILSRQSIMRRLTDDSLRRIEIEPFFLQGRAYGRSYGLSCAGYDVRLAQDIWLWPLWGRKGSIMEYLKLPADVRGKVEDKSTNARIFVTVQNTNIEPGWDGYLTVELTRHLPWPIYLRKGTPIAQIIFQLLDEPTCKPYNGKYNHQKPGPQPAILPT